MVELMDTNIEGSVLTLEGVVEKGQVRLSSNVRLPDKTRVYVIVPGVLVQKVAHMSSPRLADRAQAGDFTLEVVEKRADAGL